MKLNVCIVFLMSYSIIISFSALPLSRSFFVFSDGCNHEPAGAIVSPSLAAGLMHAHTHTHQSTRLTKKSDDCYRVLCSFSSLPIDRRSSTFNVCYLSLCSYLPVLVH